MITDVYGGVVSIVRSARPDELSERRRAFASHFVVVRSLCLSIERVVDVSTLRASGGLPEIDEAIRRANAR